MRFLFSCKIALLAVFVSSCATGPVNIPPDTGPDVLIQRAQEASDKNRYKIALQYYEALLERNLTNIDLICTAEYEIAFIHYKQKQYDQARTEFNELLERYNATDAELLPQQYKTLSLIVLDRIKEKEEQRARFFPKSKTGEGNQSPETSADLKQ
jgi:tetratricopeptide (TPR) repeat protein